MQKTLDLSIKKSELGTVDGGYDTKCGRPPYPSYMDRQAWEEFKDDMEKNHPDAFEAYGAGAGGEMKEKGGFPPKMASFGSSSRMIYTLCKDVPKFHFEYPLPTGVGGKAHLDGFLEKEDTYLFVEAKCREPYGTKKHLIESTYRELYQYINNDHRCNLSIQTDQEEPKMNVVFGVGNRTITCFDIKQMICHLLGVAIKFLHEPTDKNIWFMYLCYNPKLIEIYHPKKEKAIFTTYDKMCEEARSIDWEALFETIVRYLRDQLHVGCATDRDIHAMLCRFDFILCDQSDFREFL